MKAGVPMNFLMTLMRKKRYESRSIPFFQLYITEVITRYLLVTCHTHHKIIFSLSHACDKWVCPFHEFEFEFELLAVSSTLVCLQLVPVLFACG